MPRTYDEWYKEIHEDMNCIHTSFVVINDDKTLLPTKTRQIAYMLKEARRLQSDIYRMAQEVYDIDKETIDDVHGL